MDHTAFRRSKHNPIITIQDLPFHAAAVLNPGATVVGDQVVLLLRVEDRNGHSSIHVARSRNGVGGWDIESRTWLRRSGSGTSIVNPRESSSRP